MPNLTSFTPSWREAGVSRHEPQTFGAAVPDDPYAAWLARREADQERQGTGVRWVFRPRTVAAAPLGASAAGAPAPGARVTRV
jgi:hypothetical protein